MILGEQENVFLFEFGLIVPAVLKCLFRHNFGRRSLPPAKKLSLFTISAGVVYHLQKSYPYLLIFAPIKDFLDVYNVEQLVKRKIL